MAYLRKEQSNSSDPSPQSPKSTNFASTRLGVKSRGLVTIDAVAKELRQDGPRILAAGPRWDGRHSKIAPSDWPGPITLTLASPPWRLWRPMLLQFPAAGPDTSQRIKGHIKRKSHNFPHFKGGKRALKGWS